MLGAIKSLPHELMQGAQGLSRWTECALTGSAPLHAMHRAGASLGCPEVPCELVLVLVCVGSCEGSWKTAFRCCSWGVSTFFVNLGTIGWIQFAPASTTQVSSVVAVTACLCFWGSCSFPGAPFGAPGPVSSQASALPNRSSQPKGGFNGLPFDWHVAPATKLD